MPQTSYSRSYTQAFAGQIGNTGLRQVDSYINDQGADIPAGVFLSHKAEGTADLPAGSTERLAGVALNSFARDPDGLAGTAAYNAGADVPVLSEGAVWVVCEEAMAITDNVFVRYATGTGTQLGAVRNDADTATARRVTGARVLIPSSGAGVVLIYLSVAADTSNL